MSRSIFVASLKFLALLIVSIDAQYERDCTVDGQAGMCVKVRDCPTVSNIVQQSREQAIAYLRRNHCGFEGSNPKVCCVSINANPDERTSVGDRRTVLPINPVTPRPTENPQFVADNRLLPSDCGPYVFSKIVGGDRTELTEFPWMVLLEYQKPNGRTTACGGVLISKRYVLTAAHCIKGKDLPVNWRLTSVRLGEYDTDSERDCVKDDEDSVVCADDPISVSIEEQIAHEEYRPLSRDQRNDIALLRLSYDVPFTKYIKPICLPSNSEIGNTVFVAGWGKTENRSSSNIKLKLLLPLADMEQCGQTYRAAGVRLGFGQICAGGQRNKDSCRGDSGGPLMELVDSGDKSKWNAVGVVSFGPTPCGMQGWPGVYTRVGDFVPWIVSKLRE